MRTEHIILALNIAREQSITKAAETLFISQPNASNMLKALEREIGYPLFVRTPNGMVPTEKGSAFLKHAATIEQSLHAITQIKDPVKQISLRILSIHFAFSDMAFEKLCKKYCSDDFSCKLSFRNIDSTEEARKALESGEADITVVVCTIGMYDSVLRHAAKVHIETEIICKRHLEVTCRKGHPILANGNIDYSLFHKYQAFTGIQAIVSDLYLPYYFSKQDIMINSLITMGPGPSRYRLLKETDGYLINTPVPESIKSEYGLESAVIEGSDIVVFAAYQKDARAIDMIQEYIGYCKEFVR